MYVYTYLAPEDGFMVLFVRFKVLFAEKGSLLLLF